MLSPSNYDSKMAGKPVFITHRTEAQIKEAVDTLLKDLIDPEEDSARVKDGHSKWLVTIGICTHLVAFHYQTRIMTVGLSLSWITL